MAKDVNQLKEKLTSMQLGSGLHVQGALDEKTREFDLFIHEGERAVGVLKLGSNGAKDRSSIIIKDLRVAPEMVDKRIDHRLMWKLCQLAQKHEIDAVDVECAADGYVWSLLGVDCKAVGGEFSNTVKANAEQMLKMARAQHRDVEACERIMAGLDDALASENPPHALRHLAGRGAAGKALLKNTTWTATVEGEALERMQQSIESRNTAAARPELSSAQDPAQAAPTDAQPVVDSSISR